MNPTASLLQVPAALYKECRVEPAPGPAEPHVLPQLSTAQVVSSQHSRAPTPLCCLWRAQPPPPALHPHLYGHVLFPQERRGTVCRASPLFNMPVLGAKRLINSHCCCCC